LIANCCNVKRQYYDTVFMDVTLPSIYETARHHIPYNVVSTGEETEVIWGLVCKLDLFCFTSHM